MDMTLREYIKWALDAGTGSVVPTWVQKSITELQEKVAELEGGVGMTVTYSDIIALSISNDAMMNGVAGNVIVPVDGTVKNFAGFAETTHTDIKLTIIRVSAILPESRQTYPVTSNPSYFNLDIEVKAGDILSFILTGTTPAPEPAPTPTPDPTPTPAAETPIEPAYDFTNVNGSFKIQLPPTTIGAGNA